MSFEAIDEEPLLNEEPNISTVTEEPKCKTPSCFTLSLIGVGITALVILIIGLSIGLTKDKDSTSQEINPVQPPSDFSRTIPSTYTHYPSATPRVPETPSTSSSSSTSTTTGFSPFPTKTPTRSSVPTATPTPYSQTPISHSPSPSASTIKTSEPTIDDLPRCQIYPQMECVGGASRMDAQYTNHTFHTPTRGAEGWRPGYQDMSVLTGYAQLKYKPGRTGCTVNIITKTKRPLTLTYHFDGVAQTSNSKDYDSSYTGLLKVKVTAASGEQLELDDIDFIWNNQPIAARNGDYRNGQKGAVVELFGWPDEDIEKECKHIAEAGYLGVKLFPHQEQLMADQPDNGLINPWYWMYQPISYRLQGRMGTRDQLRKMIKTCRSYGLRVYADAVVNHMTGGGNDVLKHRNPNAGCAEWDGQYKYSSINSTHNSPFYTPSWTYSHNHRGEPDNVLEFPGVPYGPMDFHCNKGLNSWSDPEILNTGWLSGLSDLDTSQEYVRQRICDYFVDLLSIGFSGFRVDAAKHIHPDDLAVIFAKFKESMGGSLPEDWFTWLEVLTGGESYLLVQSGSSYSFTTYFEEQLKKQGMSADDILKIKIWWCGYPVEPYNDNGSIDKRRKVIQNDDHDQQNPGSSSRDMHDAGCVLVKGCEPSKHRGFEVMLFNNPPGADNNDNDYPIRMVLSSYYFENDIMSIPDGKSVCSLCKATCNGCRGREKIQAYQENAQAYSGKGYTYVHRDNEIIQAMRKWMHL